MASRSIPIALQQARRRTLTRVSVRTPSLSTAAVILITVLILLRWLHLILAMEIASTGRQLQAATAELSRLERANALLLDKIAEAESPDRLADEARRLGYSPGTPIYLMLSEPLPGDEAGQPAQPDSLGGELAPLPGFSPGPDPLAGGFSTWLEMSTTP